MNEDTRYGNSRFCEECGYQFQGTEQFCVKCGTQREQMEVLIQQISMEKASEQEVLNKIEPEQKKRWKKGSLLMICVMVAVLLLAGLYLGGVFKPGYEKVVDKYFKALKNTDGELYYSIMAEDYIDDRISGWGYTKRELIEKYENDLKNTMETYEYRCGDKVKISHKIVDTYHPTKDEIYDLNRWLEDYGFERDSIQDAMVVYYEYTVKGTEEQLEYEGERLVIKVNGKWCITGGSIDLSWYEQ